MVPWTERHPSWTRLTLLNWPITAQAADIMIAKSTHQLFSGSGAACSQGVAQQLLGLEQLPLLPNVKDSPGQTGSHCNKAGDDKQLQDAKRAYKGHK